MSGVYRKGGVLEATNESLELILLSKREIDPITNCWLWQGNIMTLGYGRVKHQNITYKVHRLAATLWKKNTLQKNDCVYFVCNNKNCFNPDHLLIGNIKDAIKNRSNKQKIANIGKPFISSYQRHKTKRLTEKKIYYLKNKSILREKGKNYYRIDKARIVQQHKDYRAANPEKILTARRKHYEKNKVYMIKKAVEYEARRKKIDPVYKLNKSFRTLVRNGLKRACIKKEARTFACLPYTLLELVKHLESQFKPEMSWANYGKYWHVDHIIPISWFTFTSQNDIEFQRCWALSNLQPLEASNNLRKNGLKSLKRKIEEELICHKK